MTLFYSEEDQFYDLTGTRRPDRPSSPQETFATSLRRHIRRAIGRTGAALKIMHQAVVAAKMRRVERELMFHNGAYDRWFGEPDAHGHKLHRTLGLRNLVAFGVGSAVGVSLLPARMPRTSRSGR